MTQADTHEQRPAPAPLGEARRPGSFLAPGAGGAARPLRVLLVAGDCNPEWPSLPIVAYKACRSIAERTDATVATHVRNREAIERAGFGRARVEYIDNEYVARPVYRLGRFLRGGDKVAWTINTALEYPSALAFEWEVW